jgi:hypothetical protein
MKSDPVEVYKPYFLEQRLKKQELKNNRVVPNGLQNILHKARKEISISLG